MKNCRPLVVHRRKEAIILLERIEKTPNAGLVLPDGAARSDDPDLVEFIVRAKPAGADWLDFQVGDSVIVGVPSGFQRVNPLQLSKERRWYLLSSKFILAVETEGDIGAELVQ